MMAKFSVLWTSENSGRGICFILVGRRAFFLLLLKINRSFAELSFVSFCYHYVVQGNKDQASVWEVRDKELLYKIGSQNSQTFHN